MSKSKEALAVTAVYDYLVRQNRPYSAIDIFSNLHKEHGKTLVVKACEQLTQDGKIKEKLYGKQKVYAADQGRFADVNDAEIKQMDIEISEMTAETRLQQDECKKLDANLRFVTSAISTEAAIAECNELEELIQQKSQKLTTIKASGDLVTPEERREILKQREIYVKGWRKRKRIANEILNAILEGYPKSKKQLYEEVGLETDEECGAVVPEV